MSRRKPVPQDELVSRTDAEHDERMPIHAVAQARACGTSQILADGQGIDIADAASVQVAGPGMVQCVRAPPIIVGRERKDAENPSHPVVEWPPGEKRAVPAIMLDQEQPHEKAGRRHGEQPA
jgi:hypothetical protein